MSDYNLFGLDPRRFEQMVQALSLSALGSDVRIFGDGPDRGRDGTFHGRRKLVGTEVVWDGNGVIQVKYKQRTEGTRLDQQWALDQLRNELRDFRRGLRDCPDYYVFSTNVVLTPAAGGGKDQAVEMLRELCNNESLALKDFLILDHDQLCAMLDANADVRLAFGAYITTGDVLGAIAHSTLRSAQYLERALVTFLQKELLRDQFLSFNRRGRGGAESLVARVFVDLPASPNSYQSAAHSDLTDRPAGGIVAHLLAQAASSVTPAGHETLAGRVSDRAAPGRSLLVGGPGQGKSTVTQLLCQLHRFGLLRARIGRDAPIEVQHAMSLIQDCLDREHLNAPFTLRFPLRIVLAEFASSGANSLLQYCTARIRQATTSSFNDDDLREWLSVYPWLVVLDGLDEVPASANRNEVLTAISEFWVDVEQSHGDVFVLATTRPQGYSGEFRGLGYEHMWLQPLSAGAALHYAGALIAARHPGDDEKQASLLRRMSDASGDADIRKLMSTPLQAAILSDLVEEYGPPPRERHSLFSAFYETIYNRERNRGIPASEILVTSKPVIDSLHRRVGLLLHVRSEQAGSTEARLSPEELELVVLERLQEDGYTGKAAAKIVASIIDAATDRLVFLVAHESREFGFEIRSVQEFMAAEELMFAHPDLVRKRLSLIAPKPHWRNVSLFAAGRCFARDQYLRDSILALCVTMNEEEERPLLALLRVGSSLALDLLNDGSVSQQPAFEKALARIACNLIDVADWESHESLARVATSDTAVAFWESLGSHLVPNDRRWANAWRVLLSAGEDLGHAPTDQELRVVIRQQKSLADIVQLAPRYPVVDVVAACLASAIGEREPFPVAMALRKQAARVGREAVLNAWSRAPSWFRGFVEYAIVEHRVHLNVGRGGELAECSLLDGAYTDDLASFVAADQLPTTWDAMRASANFALRPEVRSLAAVLDSVAAGSAVGVWGPWPLSAFLRRAEGAEELRFFGARVRRGDAGDIEEWRHAQSRWRRHGVEVRDFQNCLRHDLPVFREISVQGFPVWAVEGWAELSAGSFEGIERSSRWSGNPAAQRGLARLASRCVARQHWTPISPQAEWFLSLVEGRTPSSGEEGRRWLSNFSFNYGVPNWGRRLVDTVGEALRLDEDGEEYGVLDEATVESLCTEVREGRSSLGLLRVLAVEGRHADLRGVIARLVALMENPQEDGRRRSVALVIALQHWKELRE